MLSQRIEFLLHVMGLKKVARKGWVEKVGVEHPESVADHSFAVAILTMVLSDMKKLDTEKAMKMALLHDLAEAKMGDFLPEEKRAEVKLREEKTILEMLSSLPPKQYEEYSHIWLEFKAQKSREAILVKSLDLIDMAAQALVYEMEGYDQHKLEEFWKSVDQNILDEDCFKILKLLKKMREAHGKGNNRKV